MAKVVWSRGKQVHDSGVFKVTVENPGFAERGHTVRLQSMFEHVNDGLVDLTSPTLKIFEGSTQLGTNITPTNDSTGVYYHDYTVPDTAKTGPHVAEWSGSYDGKAALIRTLFYVRRTVT